MTPTSDHLGGVIGFGAVAAVNGMRRIGTGRRNLVPFAPTALIAIAPFFAVRGAIGAGA